jgi:sRNA-binding regulator protein Hfq
MSSSDSMVYTMGTALHRARDLKMRVQILVQGHWLSGRVIDLDGYGLVLEREDTDHVVVRLEIVAAVRVNGNTPDGEDSPMPDHIPVEFALPVPRGV